MNDEEIRRLLQAAVPSAEASPATDLWPRMLRRMEQQPRGWRWWDWALAGAVSLWCLLFPEMIPGLLYHL